MRLEFFYIAPTRLRAALEGRGVEGVDRHGERATVRSEPVARVSLPATVAVELLLRIVETGAFGIEDLGDQANDWAREFAALGKHLMRAGERFKNLGNPGERSGSGET